MKITAIEPFVCDGGLREFGFLKVTTDEGIVGWAETYDWHTSASLATALEVMGRRLIGEDPGEALGSGIVIGFAAGAVIALAGAGTLIWSGDDLGLALVILGASFPLLALQDVGRFVAFATRRPVAAIHLDLAWLVLLPAGILGAAAFTDLALPGLVLGWVGAGSVAGLIVLWQHREHHVRITLAWVRRC